MRNKKSLEISLLMSPEFSQYDGSDSFVFQGKVFYKKPIPVGKGTFAEVFCFESSDHTKVAVKMEFSRYKIYQEGPNFKKEADWYQKIYGLGLFSGDANDYRSPHYVLMPYFEGKTLGLMAYTSPQHLFFYWIKTADAINTLHWKYHAVHGDLTQNNLIVTNDQKVIPVDFGLMMGPREKYRVDLLDTPRCHQQFRQYPPEAFLTRLLPLTAHVSQDIYALGILLKDLFEQFLVSHFFSHPSQNITDTVNDVHKNLTLNNPRHRWSIAKAIYMLTITFFSKIPRHIWIENLNESKLELQNYTNFLTFIWRNTSALAIAIRTNELMDEQDELELHGKKSERKAQKINGLQKLYSDIQIKNPEQFGAIVSETQHEFPELMAGIFSRRTRTLIGELASAAPAFH